MGAIAPAVEGVHPPAWDTYAAFNREALTVGPKRNRSLIAPADK